jgi:cardiolipin synthase A/B
MGLSCSSPRPRSLQGKFVAWNDDDIVVMSFNWASASTSLDKPCDEAGVHIAAPGIATAALNALRKIYPQLSDPSRT